MVESVDTRASGARERKFVGVQVPSSAFPLFTVRSLLLVSGTLASVTCLRITVIPPRPRGRNARPQAPAKGPQVLDDRIRATEFRLVSDDETKIVSRKEAEAIAEETGLDLIVVSLDSSPPVLRLIDYGKYKYEQEKKQREAKKKQHTTTIKEVKMGVRIDSGDFNIKARNASKFLQEGNKVKLTIRLRGREMQHTELAFELAKRFVIALEEDGTLEGDLKKEGRTFIVILSPNSKK